MFDPLSFDPVVSEDPVIVLEVEAVLAMGMMVVEGEAR